jgi:hypothetical protein
MHSYYENGISHWPRQTVSESPSGAAAGLRIVVTAGVLLLGGLVGHNLYLVRACLDSVTVGLALADAVIVLVLHVLAD